MNKELNKTESSLEYFTLCGADFKMRLKVYYSRKKWELIAKLNRCFRKDRILLVLLDFVTIYYFCNVPYSDMSNDGHYSKIYEKYDARNPFVCDFDLIQEMIDEIKVALDGNSDALIRFETKIANIEYGYI